MRRIAFVVLTVGLAGCDTGAGTAPKPVDGTTVAPKNGKTPEKMTGAVERYETVPLPPKQ